MLNLNPQRTQEPNCPSVPRWSSRAASLGYRWTPRFAFVHEQLLRLKLRKTAAPVGRLVGILILWSVKLPPRSPRVSQRLVTLTSLQPRERLFYCSSQSASLCCPGRRFRYAKSSRLRDSTHPPSLRLSRLIKDEFMYQPPLQNTQPKTIPQLRVRSPPHVSLPVVSGVRS